MALFGRVVESRADPSTLGFTKSRSYGPGTCNATRRIGFEQAHSHKPSSATNPYPIGPGLSIEKVRDQSRMSGPLQMQRIKKH